VTTTRLLMVIAVAAALSACAPADTKVPATTPRILPSGPASPYSKVVIIPEENKSYGEIMGNPAAPYLNRLARTYGTVTRMDAGYPASCPSLAAYILMTSGSDHGICDDADADAHRLTGANVFQQVADAGKQWRTYAESMPASCAHTDSGDGLYVPRHAPAPYYVTESGRCGDWDKPMGTASKGAFRDDLAAGTLPEFAFLTPNNCHNMHGAPDCRGGAVAGGDSWLRQWLPRILAGPDYRAGRLLVIITWDEGTADDNHIPTLLISPTTRDLSADGDYSHCSTLRTVEEVLRLPIIGCARTARSLRADFHL
jgi:hypothetical protein